MSYESETQEKDIAASWHNCTMYQSEPDEDSAIRVLMVEEDKVIAHFIATEEEDQIATLPVSWMKSKVGQAEQPRKFKQDGFTVTREVRYNSLTNEVIL